MDHFRVPITLTFKTRLSANISCENECFLHENKKSFSHQWYCTYPRFETDAWATQKWPITVARNGPLMTPERAPLTLFEQHCGFVGVSIDVYPKVKHVATQLYS